MALPALEMEARLKDYMSGELAKIQAKMINLGDTGNTSFKKVNEGAKGANAIIGDLGGTMAGLVRGFTVAAIAGSAFYKTIQSFNEAMQLADRFKKMSDQLNIATDSLQSLDYIARQSGGSAEGLAFSMRFLARSAADGSKEVTSALQRLSINTKDSNGNIKDMNSLFFEAVDKLNKVTNDTERTALAMRIFGRSCSDVLPLLRMSTEDLDKMKNKARELGQIMGDRTVFKLDKLGDDWKTFSRAVVNAVGTMGADVQPILSRVYESIAKIAAKITEYNEFSAGPAASSDVAAKPAATTKPIDPYAEQMASVAKLEGQLKSYGKQIHANVALNDEQYAQYDRQVTMQKNLISVTADAEKLDIGRAVETKNAFERLKKDLEDLEKLRGDFNTKRLIDAKEAADKEAEINEDLAELKEHSYISLAHSSISALQKVAQASKAGGETAKRLAQIQAMVDTYAAANASYKAMAGIPYVGPVLGGVAAGAAIIAGLANVAIIEQQKFQRGGMVQGGSLSGDRTMIGANAGEVVFTNQQAARMFNVLEGGTRTNNNSNVTINLSVPANANASTVASIDASLRDFGKKLEDASRRGYVKWNNVRK